MPRRGSGEKTVASLNHVNIRTRDVDAMRTFLEEVAGLAAGPRPDFATPGYWMYSGDDAVVHLNLFAGDPAELGTGSVDHIAFGTYDYDAKLRELKDAGFAVRTNDVPGRPLRQIFVDGPDGVCLELQCPTGGAG